MPQVLGSRKVMHWSCLPDQRPLERAQSKAGGSLTASTLELIGVPELSSVPLLQVSRTV